jgi:hypothetical protein
LATDAARVSSARGVLGTSAAVVVIVLAAVLPYLGILRAPFVFDDVKLVKDNRLLRSGFRDPAALIETFNVASHRWDEEELRPNYRPLRFLSYVADYELSRAFLSPFPEDSPPCSFFTSRTSRCTRRTRSSSFASRGRSGDGFSAVRKTRRGPRSSLQGWGRCFSPCTRSRRRR